MSGPIDDTSRGALAARVRPAFPPQLEDSVAAAVAATGDASLGPTRGGISPVPIMIKSAPVDIPSRIYVAEPSEHLHSALDDTTKLVVACLYTRHHDGHVRERWLRRVVTSSEPWIIPFVVQLLGEYVAQIAEVIAENLPQLDASAYQRFAAENPTYVDLTAQRAVSYSLYYPGSYPRFVDYPSYRALHGLGIWRGSHGQRRIAKGR